MRIMARGQTEKTHKLFFSPSCISHDHLHIIPTTEDACLQGISRFLKLQLHPTIVKTLNKTKLVLSILKGQAALTGSTLRLLRMRLRVASTTLPLLGTEAALLDLTKDDIFSQTHRWSCTHAEVQSNILLCHQKKLATGFCHFTYGRFVYYSQFGLKCLPIF